MFDAVRENKRIVQLFLALITLPFAFWGVDSYIRHMGNNTDVATVDGTTITQQEFQKAWRDRSEQMRRMLGAKFDPKDFDTPEARLAIVDDLVTQRLLLQEARHARMGVSDDAVREVIASIPALQEGGKFSMKRYEQALAGQGMSQQGFEALIRQNLTLDQIVGGIGGTAFASTALAEAQARRLAEERQVEQIAFSPDQYLNQVKLEENAAKDFYEKNQKQFEIPDKLRAEFVVLSLEAVQAQVSVSANEVKEWYEGHKDRYQANEERRASHILFAVDSSAPAADKEKAKSKAEQVLAEVKKNPAKFAELAKQYSQDPGSAAKGGDLGFFGRGMMVKPFEEAAFKLKEGELSALVQSDFGYHIIKLTGVKGGKGKSFEDVRGEIESELKRQAAQRKFAEAAEVFSNLVYEQSDSLKPAADKFKLNLQQGPWLPRNVPPQAMASLGPLGNAKLLGSLFADDAVKNKRNTEAVEVAPNTLVAARVLEYKPAAQVPLEQVKGEIEKRLRYEQAVKLANAAGADKLKALSDGKGEAAGWSKAETLSRLDTRNLPPPVLAAVFKTDVKKLPAYGGSETPAGYVLFRIAKVSQPEKVDEKKLAALKQQYLRSVSQQDLDSYLKGLRSRYKVELHKEAIGSAKE